MLLEKTANRLKLLIKLIKRKDVDTLINACDAGAERIWERNKAEAIKIKCQGKPGIVSEESKPAKETCPLLYDLTSLQEILQLDRRLQENVWLLDRKALFPHHLIFLAQVKLE